MTDRGGLCEPGRAGRRDYIGGEGHRTQDHEREAKTAEGFAIPGPEPCPQRDGKEEMRCVDQAAGVLEQLGVRELSGCSLKDQSRLVPIEEVTIERPQVM